MAPPSETLAGLRGLVRARAASSPNPSADWTRVLALLDEVEDQLVKSEPSPPVVAMPRGLTAVAARPFVAIVGIDKLGSLRNDHGEVQTEFALREVCRRIQRSSEHVQLGRINRSSIEFTFFADAFEAAEQLLSQLQRDLEAPIELMEHSLVLDVAIGFAGRDTEDDSVELLIDQAEHALARARAGHVKIDAFTQHDRIQRAERLSLMRDLHAALNDETLTVYYQPKLSLRASAITSAEALVRWRHPERGFVSPDQFIPLAEENGDIRALTEQVVRLAIGHADHLAALGRAVRIDLNISGALIADASFAKWVLKALEGRENWFGFEITETAVIANPAAALSHIHAFSDAGVAIAIDDYGSGLSSLCYLKQIPANELKIDKSFVSGLTSSQRDPLLVRSTIDLAHALEMEVTAEGVDNPMSLALLRVMGCDMIQGYHLSKPLPYEDLLVFLEDFAPERYDRVRSFSAASL